VKLNQAGIDLIKVFEGLELKPYQDVAGLWTIGYGHLIKPGEHFTEITKEQAEDLLRMDLGEVTPDVKECVKSVINDNQFSALVCFAYNVGSNALKTSTLLKKLNAGNIEGAEQEFLRWNKARVNGELIPVSGLTRRREAEAKLFSTPV
jgi:lysozyme